MTDDPTRPKISYGSTSDPGDGLAPIPIDRLRRSALRIAKQFRSAAQTFDRIGSGDRPFLPEDEDDLTELGGHVHDLRRALHRIRLGLPPE